MNISRHGYTQCPCCHAHFQARELVEESPICHSCGKNFTQSCGVSKSMLEKARGVFGKKGVLLTASLLGASVLMSCGDMTAPVYGAPAKEYTQQDGGEASPSKENASVDTPVYGLPPDRQ